MMTNKKLGLLLAPLIPLTAIGVVEVARELASLSQPTPVVEVREIRVERPAPPTLVEPPPPVIVPAPPPPQGLETA